MAQMRENRRPVPRFVWVEQRIVSLIQGIQKIVEDKRLEPVVEMDEPVRLPGYEEDALEIAAVFAEELADKFREMKKVCHGR